MGNYKFRFSDMMPNAWFYKLKDMGSRRRSRTQKTNTPSLKKKQPTTATSQSQPPKSKQPHHLSHSRKSYYFTRDPISSPKFSNSPKYTHFPDDPPRKSSKQAAKKKISSKTPKSSPSSKLLTSSVSAATGCNCRVTFETVSDFSPEFTISPLDSSPDHHRQSESRSDDALVTESFDGMVALSSYSNSNDIVIDINKKSPAMKFETEDGFNSISELELPRIITKSVKSKHRKSSAKTESLSVSALKEEQRHTIPAIRRLSTHNSSPGMRLRVKSPRIANITTQIGGGGRRSISNNSSTSSSSRSRNGRSISDSFAVVKSSFNPQKDFKESMMEMIVENNIKASKDLEELLACYLSLNSDEYHDLIIKVFKQIWFDLTDSKWKWNI